MATTTIAVPLDDSLLALVRNAAGETSVDEWIAKACRDRLLHDELHHLRRWENEHPDEAARERAAEAQRILEHEAETEVCVHAEKAAQQRGGPGTEPTHADYAEAVRHVRDLLAQAERRLSRDQGQ
ncbi:hypothetical protein [Nocardia suismassiliense]|uniref:hypothetical protein n=1 Tax=Nocardia suismassiliense TaxID=2077092 RepID=UPI000D1DF3A3|nr:hypothetical protein [Nocardia suismassiliense]